MLDLKLIREKPELVKERLRKKFVNPVAIDNIHKLDVEKRNLQTEAEALKAKQNKASEKIPTLGKEEREKMLKELQYVKEQLGELRSKLNKIEKEIEMQMMTLPNIPFEDIPDGEDANDNVVVRTVGEKPVFGFPVLDHMALGKHLDLVDIENAAKISGARFYYLKNDLVLLQFALMNYVMGKLVKKGFSPILPPVLVKEHAMYGTGFFPAERNEIYHVNPADDDLYLVGTSEVALCGLHQDQILRAEDLPRRYAGFSTCFRREAGSYGKDTSGILRVHQFDKIEMFSFCHPETGVSEQEHEFLLGIEEEIMTELGFHYQVIDMCGGELRNSPAARKYDIEVWIPSQNKFRELTSCSNCTDFQARRMNIRMKDSGGSAARGGTWKNDGQAVGGGQGGGTNMGGSGGIGSGESSKKGSSAGGGNKILHTLNGTAMASTRTLIAIMENYQTKEKTIKIPSVLQPYFDRRQEIGGES